MKGSASNFNVRYCNYKSTSQRAQWSEQDLAPTIDAVKYKTKLVLAACREFGIPSRTPIDQTSTANN